MATYEIDPDDAELVGKLAKAAFYRSHVESVARLREHHLADDEDSYHLAWQALDEEGP